MNSKKGKISKEQIRPLLTRLSKLYTPIVSDIMDEMNILDHVIDPSIRPLYPNRKIVGKAITGKVIKYDTYERKDFRDWAKVMVEMLSVAEPGDIFVIDSGGAKNIATWGEIMSRAAVNRGSVGAITDGAIRDTPRIFGIKPLFQVYYRAITPLDAKGRIQFIQYNSQITCGGVNVEPGDFILGDNDGVVFLPNSQARRIISKCEERYKIEQRVGVAVKNKANLLEAVDKYGIF
jgi:4-hydroxy-4-methyl-2-oxoglutarate aldolase